MDLVTGDVTDPAAANSALHGIDIVCHQSAKVGLGVSFADAPDYIRNNDYGTAILLAAMERHGITRLVLASSMVVYGEGAYADSGNRQTGRPGPARRGGSSRRHLRSAQPGNGGRTGPRDGHRGCRHGSEERLRSVEAEPGAPRLFVGPEHRRVGDCTALPQRLRPQDAQNTPYAGVASLFRSALARGEAPRVFEDGAQRAQFHPRP